MKVTATQVSRWAATKEGQNGLPRLVRRLIHSMGRMAQASFPTGDSTSRPGWDGQLVSTVGSTWIPKGRSYWELSCDSKCTAKANKDYKKRTKGTLANERKRSTLVIVTGRKWNQKARWLTHKLRTRQWRSIRVYDSDDLEQWIEESAAVALQFSEELGLAGPGVESIERFWSSWSRQSKPAITAQAVSADREAAQKQLLQGLGKGGSNFLEVRADSIAEAAAFVCCTLLRDLDVASNSVVVTHGDGWRFVAQHPRIAVALAAQPVVADPAPSRAGLTVIVPVASGHPTRLESRQPQGQNYIALDRPHREIFERALVGLGLDEADAERLAASTGRSWSVFRRHRADNPAIRRPTWLATPGAAALSTLCLVGGWSAASVRDRSIIAHIANRPYEDIERDLRRLAAVDEAPVLAISSMWIAKSPLELLGLIGERLTLDEVDRFFAATAEILSASDPILELPDGERYAAQIRGRVRSESPQLLRALSDGLVKFAVHGPQLPALAAMHIDSRVARLVHELLYDCDANRWLSLASVLPALAEAAPDAFLAAAERSLELSSRPLVALLEETSESTLAGRCWHAGLLWALETLAWAPSRFARIVRLLGRLAPIRIKGNWGNSPKSTLVNLFRSWMPQTSATLEQRIAALDFLIAKDSQIAFDILNELVKSGSDIGGYSARPAWRDDDVGAGRGVPQTERYQMLVNAADRMIALSHGHPRRIAGLISKLLALDASRRKEVFLIVEKCADDSISDEDRDTIRGALRQHLTWHKIGRRKSGGIEVDALNRLYQKLAPTDIVIRHGWLFADAWIEVIGPNPDDHAERARLLEAARADALREILAHRGLAGIQALALANPGQPYVGYTLATLAINPSELAAWIASWGGEFSDGDESVPTITGLLHGTPGAGATDLIAAVLQDERVSGWQANRIAALLALARAEQSTWAIVEECGSEVENAYWARVRLLLRERTADFEFAVRRLLGAKRPRTALSLCQYSVEEMDALLLVDVLEALVTVEESNGPPVRPWAIGRAIDRLEEAPAVDRERLALIELWLMTALREEGSQKAKSLYVRVMSDAGFFSQLVCAAYKPDSSSPQTNEPLSERASRVAKVAWEVLYYCRRQPGSASEGTVNSSAFVKFVDEVREQCRQAGRLSSCESTLGQILAYAPAGADRVWPFEAAREILDRVEMEHMREAFRIGIWNKHGERHRAYDEGGDQERKLASTYRGYAQALQASHVYLAGALEQVAATFEHDAGREDLEVRLRRERM